MDDKSIRLGYRREPRGIGLDVCCQLVTAELSSRAGAMGMKRAEAKATLKGA